MFLFLREGYLPCGGILDPVLTEVDTVLPAPHRLEKASVSLEGPLPFPVSPAARCSHPLTVRRGWRGVSLAFR